MTLRCSVEQGGDPLPWRKRGDALRYECGVLQGIPGIVQSRSERRINDNLYVTRKGLPHVFDYEVNALSHHGVVSEVDDHEWLSLLFSQLSSQVDLLFRVQRGSESDTNRDNRKEGRGDCRSRRPILRGPSLQVNGK
jgi:hypothetical protein